MTNREVVVYKYGLNELVTRLPWGVIRHIAPQRIGDDLPTAWIEHTVGSDSPNQVEIRLVVTGEKFTPPMGDRFVSTSVCAHGQFAVHAYWRPVPSSP